LHLEVMMSSLLFVIAFWSVDVIIIVCDCILKWWCHHYYLWLHFEIILWYVIMPSWCVITLYSTVQLHCNIVLTTFTFYMVYSTKPHEVIEEVITESIEKPSTSTTTPDDSNAEVRTDWNTILVFFMN